MTHPCTGPSHSPFHPRSLCSPAPGKPDPRTVIGRACENPPVSLFPPCISHACFSIVFLTHFTIMRGEQGLPCAHSSYTPVLSAWSAILYDSNVIICMLCTLMNIIVLLLFCIILDFKGNRVDMVNSGAWYFNWNRIHTRRWSYGPRDEADDNILHNFWTFFKLFWTFFLDLKGIEVNIVNISV